MSAEWQQKNSCHDKAAKKGGVSESFFGMNWPIYLDLHKMLGKSKTYYDKWRFYHGTMVPVKNHLKQIPVQYILYLVLEVQQRPRIESIFSGASRDWMGSCSKVSLHAVSIFISFNSHLKSADAPKNIPLPKKLPVSFREGKHLQRSSYYREIPQNYHTFALFDSPHKWVIYWPLGKHLPINVHLCCCNALLHIQVRGGPSGVWGKQDATYPKVLIKGLLTIGFP